MARKQTTYIVYRHGSNAANQSMTAVTAVGFEEAPDAVVACAQMAKRVSVYANQYLTAKPVSRASAADRDQGDYAEQGREQLEQSGAFRF